jgi:hypothetical protein
MTAQTIARREITPDLGLLDVQLVTINAAADWYAEGRRAGREQGCVTEREMVALRIIQDELTRFAGR